MTSSQHVYEVRPCADKRGVDLISDALPFGRLWYGEPNAIANAIGYAMHRSRSHYAVIYVCDATGNVIGPLFTERSGPRERGPRSKRERSGSGKTVQNLTDCADRNKAGYSYGERIYRRRAFVFAGPFP